MQTVVELERRITAAMERIGKGIDAIPAAALRASPPAAAPNPAPAASAEAAAEIAALKTALETERATSAQLAERLRSVRDREVQSDATLQVKVDRMTRQLDVQGLELQRMRKTTIQLREQLRVMTQAQAAGVTEPALINRALQAELEALRAARQSEIAEMDEILAELAPLTKEEEPQDA